MLSPEAIAVYAGIGGLTWLGLAAAGYAYGSMSPSSRLFGQTFIAPSHPGELALTFDDGPNPAWTPHLLDVLNRSDVRATFFLVGGYAESERALVRRIVEEGHVIGNHSWSHPNLAFAGITRVSDELRQTSETLEQISGRPVRYFRPPFGGRRPGVLQAAHRLGMTPVMWNAMTSDWRELSAERIAQRLMHKIDSVNGRGRAANIVLHDGSHVGLFANRGPSVNAAGQLISHYKATRRFVTLDAWTR